MRSRNIPGLQHNCVLRRHNMYCPQACSRSHSIVGLEDNYACRSRYCPQACNRSHSIVGLEDNYACCSTCCP